MASLRAASSSCLPGTLWGSCGRVPDVMDETDGLVDTVREEPKEVEERSDPAREEEDGEGLVRRRTSDAVKDAFVEKESSSEEREKE